MTLPANRINLITLAVADLARSKAFYEALGWVLEEETEHVVFFDMAGAKFGIYTRAMLAKDLGKSEDDLGSGASSLGQNFASPEDVDAAYSIALAAGATPCKAPEEIFWGGYSGTFADPDGHIWELAHNPFWPLTEDGKLA